MNGAVARRYAAALADVAIERKITERARQDLDAFAAAFAEASDLRNFLESPTIGRGAKQEAIEKIAARMDLSEPVRNFIRLIVDHRRTHELEEIRQAFGEELNARLGIAEAIVVSARALDEREKAALAEALERRTGKKIEAHFEQDASLVGGAVVRVGSTVYDGSVREQLARLQERLEAE